MEEGEKIEEKEGSCRGTIPSITEGWKGNNYRRLTYKQRGFGDTVVRGGSSRRELCTITRLVSNWIWLLS